MVLKMLGGNVGRGCIEGHLVGATWLEESGRVEREEKLPWTGRIRKGNGLLRAWVRLGGGNAGGTGGNAGFALGHRGGEVRDTS